MISRNGISASSIFYRCGGGASFHPCSEPVACGRGETGKLTVGFVSAATYAVMPNAIARFRRSHPNVELVLNELNSDEGVEEVRSGRLDVCLLHPPRSLEPALGVDVAWQESMVVALPRSHKFARTRRISLSKLKTEPWVLWRREIASRLYDEIFAACASSGFEPRGAADCPVGHRRKPRCQRRWVGARPRDLGADGHQVCRISPARRPPHFGPDVLRVAARRGVPRARAIHGSSAGDEAAHIEVA
jgi:hypothetical protein